MRKLKFFIFLFVICFSCSFLSAISIIPTSPETNTLFSTSAVSLSCSANDDIAVINVTLYVNEMSNQTNSSGFNDTTYTFSPNLADGNYTWFCGACDGEGCSNATSRIIMVDASGPVFSQNSTNSTYAGQAVSHRVYVQDVNLLSGYIFSFDNCTGSFVNDTWQSSSGAGSWANVTKSINSTSGCTIKWKVYSNDSYNKLGVSSEYSYTSQDSGFPVVSLNSPASAANLSSVSVSFNCSVTDSSISNVTLYGNWSGWHANETKSLTGTSNSTTFSKTLVANALYTWNCRVCDSSNNCNFSSSNRTFLVDTTKPTISLLSPSNNSETSNETQMFRINVTDNFNIKNCSLYVDDDLEDTDETVTNASAFYFSSLSLDGSDSGVSYNWYVNCSDFAGNINKSAVWRLIVQIDEEDDSASSSESASSDWTTTYSPNSSEFSSSAGYLKEMATKTRVKITISGASHYVGLISLTSTKATINVSSTPQQATLSIGEEKKFEVTGDNSYDVLVKLVSIANSKANVSIKTIDEKIPNLGGSSSTSQTNSSSSEELETIGGSSVAGSTSKVLGEKIWIVIVGAIVILFVVLGYYLVKRAKEQRAATAKVISPANFPMR